MSIEPDTTVSEFPIVAAETRVLSGRLIRDGYPNPTFGDDLWDLNGVVHLPTARRGIARLNFRLLDDPSIRNVAKELIYARLNELPGARRNAAPTTASSALYSFARFVGFAEETGIDLGNIRQKDLDAYLDRLSARLSVPSSRNQYVSVIKDLYRLRDRISYLRFHAPPWRMRPVQIITGAPSKSENLRLRIPEELMRPLLAYSLMYVDVASTDILNARRELAGYLSSVKPGRADASERLQQWCNRRMTEGRGIPRLTYVNRAKRDLAPGESVMNVKQCLLMAGIASQRPTDRMMRILQAYEASAGYESGGFDVEISTDPETGRPWRGRFDRDAVTKEERKLLTACYIVTAYLSGMRDSEVQSLKRGCVSVVRGRDGEPFRYRVEGTVWKGEVATGKSATWIVLPEVMRAISVLEGLGDANRIFTSTSHRNQKSVIGRMIGRWLNLFLSDALEYDQHSKGVKTLPEWRLTSGQFRRTVAWHIANRPFGVVAGMLQYKHVRVSTFEGYAGTSESGFRAEVVAEEEEFRVRDVFDQYQDHLDGAAAVSLGGERLSRRFEDIRNESGDLPGMIVDARRRDAMLRRVASDYYAGQFNDCHFEEEFAQCLKETSVLRGDEKAAPLIGACSPDTCANSTLRPHHARAWEGQLESTRDLLERPGLGANQTSIIESQIFSIESILKRFR